MRRAQKGVVACVHRWRIAEPAGPTVAGCCRLCGAQREFRTVAEPAETWGGAVAVVKPSRRPPPQRKGDGLGPLVEPARVRCERCGMETRAGAPMAAHQRKHEREGGDGLD